MKDYPTKRHRKFYAYDDSIWQQITFSIRTDCSISCSDQKKTKSGR